MMYTDLRGGVHRKAGKGRISLRRAVYRLVLYTALVFGVSTVLLIHKCIIREPGGQTVLLPEIPRYTSDANDTGGTGDAGGTDERILIHTEGFISQAQMAEALSDRSKEGTPGRLRTAQTATPIREGRIRCLTLPHHNPAAGMIITALEQVAAQDEKPDVVILLGPNHKNEGPAAAVTKASWDTPYGLVQPERDAISALMDTGLTAEFEPVFTQEHSMGAVIPWIARFLPEARIVPLLFHWQYPPDKLEILLETLTPWLEHNSLLIVSADFSHHHTRDEAQERDRIFAALAEQGDWQAIARLSSDYVDCPTLVAAMIRYGISLRLAGPDVLAHTNTGFLSGASRQEVTSYFVLSYTDPQRINRKENNGNHGLKFHIGNGKIKKIQWRESYDCESQGVYTAGSGRRPRRCGSRGV